ncbi:MAG TPA: GNAT family N-acetyltransferase [Verrucomicrobiae bacterium]|nr:GNAT family N-acetyltransferase [Verrucomicrobiae bacterium]
MPSLDGLLPKTAALIYASGPEYFDVLFGSTESALARLRSWVGRASSGFGFDRVTVALAEGEVAGIALHLSGQDLADRQRMDMLALLKESDSSQRANLTRNTDIIRAMTPTVQSWEYYLRSLSVDEAHRGKGLGAALLKQVFAAGLALSFHSFRLDVRSDNTVALKLYRSAGFEISQSFKVQPKGWELFSMRVEVKGT